MSFNKASYKATVKAAFQAAIGSETAEEDIATAFANALETAIAEIEATTGNVSVPAIGLIAPSGGGPVTGSATTASIATGGLG